MSRAHGTAEPARQVREAVFVTEQQVPREIEMDEHDASSRHVLARDADGGAIGTGRLLVDGHIGRMAVLAGWRRHGRGTEAGEAGAGP